MSKELGKRKGPTTAAEARPEPSKKAKSETDKNEISASEGETLGGGKNHIQLECGDPFPPDIYYYGKGLQEVQTYINTEGCEGNMFPKRLVEDLKKNHPSIINRIQNVLTQNGGGLAVFGRAIVATLNLSCYSGTPDGVICDTIVLTKKHRPFVFTFCNKNNADIKKYNSELAKNAKRLMRKFTREKFTSVFCVVESGPIQKQEEFEDLLKKRCQEQLLSCFQDHIIMNKEKFQQLKKALVVCIARTRIPNIQDDSKDLNESFHLLTKKQLIQVIEKTDDRMPLIVQESKLPDDTVVIFELAERLKRHAPTVLICDNITRRNRYPDVKVFLTEHVISRETDLSVFRNVILATTKVNHERLKRNLRLPNSNDTSGTRTWIFLEEDNVLSQRLNIALIGWQKTGKSSLGNAIINDSKFKTGFKTATSEVNIGSVSRSGRIVTVTDTPSISLTDTDSVSYLVNNCDSIDAVLLVLRATQLTQEQERILQLLSKSFCDSLFQKLAVIFTHVDRRPKVEDFLRDTPQHLEAMLRKCENRYLFYNIDTSSQREDADMQFRRLVQLLDSMDRNKNRCTLPKTNVEKDLKNQSRKLLKDNRKLNREFWELMQRIIA